MESFLLVIFIMFVTFAMRKGRFDAIEKGRGRRNTFTGGEPAFKPDRKLTREIDKRRTQGPASNASGTGYNGGQTSFAEDYHEDPAAVAGMKGRTSTVPSTGRSSILEADDELNEMLAARRKKPDGSEMNMLDMLFANGGVNRRGKGGMAAYHKDAKGTKAGGLNGIFEGFEDRGGDWLAMQIRDEERAKARIMSDMMSLKIEHEKEHAGIHKNIIGRRK